MSHPSPESPQVVLVPGGFSGPWMYEDVVRGLDAVGISSIVVALPTVGDATTDQTFGDDVEAVRSALHALTAPAILVAHSYGGAVITAAAAGPHRSVRELVYLAGAAPGSGESMASASAKAGEAAGQEPGGPGPAPREDGLLVFPPEVARQALFNDCSDERAAAGVAQLRPQSFAGTDQPIPVAAWTQLPSVYVRGEEDLVPRALGDGFLDHCVAVVDLPTGHCPQWSHPELVVEVLAERVRGSVPSA